MGRSKCAPETDCAHSARTLVASAEDVGEEIGLRRTFFLSRLTGPLDERDLVDLIDMTTNDAAPVYRCDCDVLVRDDPVRTAVRFARDEYDERTLRALHALHVGVFGAKDAIREMLPRGSRVLEIGSYVGGFLEAARRWGWKATGVDIGRDTAAFARRQGYDVTTERFERSEFPPHSFDGVFIWNCFEQMVNPSEVLQRVAQISRPGALLVIEVPDGSLYLEAERAFREGEPRVPESPVVQQLAYNNLLGFPHHFGYSAGSLTRLVTSCGFRAAGLRHVPAVRPLRERLTDDARDEEKRASAGWLEAMFVAG